MWLSFERPADALTILRICTTCSGYAQFVYVSDRYHNDPEADVVKMRQDEMLNILFTCSARRDIDLVLPYTDSGIFTNAFL